MTALLHWADRLHDLTSTIQRATAFREATVAGGRGRIYDTAERFRRRLDKLEAGALRQVLDEWTRIRGVIDDRIVELDQILKQADPDDTVQAIEAARDRLSRQRDTLIRQVDDYARFVQAGIHTAQAQAANLAQDEAATLVGQQLGPRAAEAGVTFNRLPSTAVEQMLGQLQTGPLQELIAGFGTRFADTIRDELVDGVALGRNPRLVARRIVQTVDMPRWRALNMTRTETLRAYRESSRRAMTANRRVVAQVRWSAALDSRTCPACWAQHGTVFPVEYTMVTHPSCRCSLLPQTKPFAELGIPGVQDTPLRMDDGPTLFAGQPAAVQRAVLGPAKYQAYQDGMFDLPDVVATRHDRDWGDTMIVRPLADLIQQ